MQVVATNTSTTHHGYVDLVGDAVRINLAPGASLQFDMPDLIAKKSPYVTVEPRQMSGVA